MKKERLLRGAPSLHLRSVCKAVVFLVLFELVFCQSEACTNSASCILPVPVKESNVASLQFLLLETRCYLGCIDQHGGSLRIIDGETQWPTVNFSVFDSDCSRYQKVRECKEGCLQRGRDYTSSINRCRDHCYTTCQEDYTNQQLTCPRSCRKTYCRFGCEVYNTIYGSSSSNSVRRPSFPPLVSNVSGEGTPDWMYSVNTLSRNHTTQANSGSRNAIVAFVVKVTTASSDNHYYWQKNSEQPLDLSPYACSKVSVSFSAVSKFSSQNLEFSPKTSVCVPGVGGYPDQISGSSIEVSYTEDFREQFVGYAIARVSWSKPNNAQYLTSYTIRIYPYEDRCGGANAIHTFRDIGKELTGFTLQAAGNSGLWKFGCSYSIEIVSLPTQMPVKIVSGGLKLTATDLTEPPSPIELNCSRVWDDRGEFSISVDWSFPNSTQLSHIHRFIVTPKLTRKASGRPLVLYDKAFLYTTNGRIKFSFMTQKFSPLVDGDDKNYLVEVKPEKSNRYTWRRIPHTESCTVPATPLPPRNITEVSVTGVNYNSFNQSLQLTVNIIPSPQIHGILQLFEVVLRRSMTDCLECNEADDLRFWSTSTPVHVQARLGANESAHCLLLNVRVLNNYNLSSHWSENQVIALDDECDHSLFESTGGDGPRVAVYYQSMKSNHKVLEFGCKSEPPSSFVSAESLDTRLQAISAKLEDITTIFQSGEGEASINTHFEIRLQAMEEKLDRILETLSQRET